MVQTKRTREPSETPTPPARRHTRKRPKAATTEATEDEPVASSSKTRKPKTPAKKAKKTKADDSDSDEDLELTTGRKTAKTPKKAKPAKPATPTPKRKVTKVRTAKKAQDDSDGESEAETRPKKGKGKAIATIKTSTTSKPPKPSVVVLPKMSALENKVKAQFEREFYKDNKTAPTGRQILDYIEGQRLAAQAWLDELGIEALEAILRKFIYDHNVRSARPDDMRPIYQHLGISNNYFAQDLVKVRTLLP
jgi:hypothetical protein